MPLKNFLRNFLRMDFQHKFAKYAKFNAKYAKFTVNTIRLNLHSNSGGQKDCSYFYIGLLLIMSLILKYSKRWSWLVNSFGFPRKLF